MNDDIKDIVRATVKETLFSLGLNIEDNDDIEEARKDLTYLRAWRKSAEKVKGIGIYTAVTILVTGICAAIFAGLSTWFK